MNISPRLKNIIIGGLVVLVVILLFMKSCGGSKKGDYSRLVAENKTLRAKVDRDSALLAQERAMFQNERDSAQKQRAALLGAKAAVDARLAGSQQRVLQLVGQLRDERARPADSSFVLISPGFVEACDTLSAVVLRQQDEIKEARQINDETNRVMGHEIDLRDSALRGEVAYSDSLRVDFRRQSDLLKTALKVLRPRGSFWVGAGLLGSPQTIVGGGRVAMAYQTKGGKQYQAGAIMAGNTLYYEGSVLVKLGK